jgi:hypothetical protein
MRTGSSAPAPPQCTFFLAFDAEQTIGLAAQVVAGDGGKRWRAIHIRVQKMAWLSGA